MPALVRVRQFGRAVEAVVLGRGLADEAVDRLLPPEAARLFRRMPRYDRRHALGVLGALLGQGETDPDLLAAALLHDVGKTGSGVVRLRLWHRVAMVLLGAAMPGTVERLSARAGAGWRRALYVQKHHAALGADLALRAGCTAAAAELIRGHETIGAPYLDPRTAALRAADDDN